MSDLKPGDIEKLLVDIMELKQKLADTKVTLKNYKVMSDRLSQLKAAKKQMQEQINDEIDRIEGELSEDDNFSEAKHDEVDVKNKIKEKSGVLRELMSKVDPEQDLSTYSYNVKGEDLKVQVERVVKVFINGKEQK